MMRLLRRYLLFFADAPAMPGFLLAIVALTVLVANLMAQRPQLVIVAAGIGAGFVVIAMIQWLYTRTHIMTLMNVHPIYELRTLVQQTRDGHVNHGRAFFIKDGPVYFIHKPFLDGREFSVCTELEVGTEAFRVMLEAELNFKVDLRDSANRFLIDGWLNPKDLLDTVIDAEYTSVELWLANEYKKLVESSGKINQIASTLELTRVRDLFDALKEIAFSPKELGISGIESVTVIVKLEAMTPQIIVKY